MTNVSPEQHHYQRLFGLRFGAVFSFVVSFGWLGFLSQFLSETWQIRIMPAVTVLLVIGIGWWLFSLFREKMPKGVSLPNMGSATYWGIFWGVIIAEVILLYVLIQLLNSWGYSEAMWPLLVVVIGLHWIPLGRINGVREWSVVAILLCIIEILTVLLWSHDATTNAVGQSINLWGLISTSAMVGVMLVTGFVFQALYSATWKKS